MPAPRAKAPHPRPPQRGRRIVLIDWDSTAATARKAALRAASHRVEIGGRSGPGLLRELRERPPALVVIDLSRLPMLGRDVGIALRCHVETRRVPLLFVAGEPGKRARVRAALPDAIFTDWKRVTSAVRRALAAPLPDPVVPASRLAGYSGTPVWRKLGVRPGTGLTLLEAPADFLQHQPPLPDGVTVRHDARKAVARVLLFARTRAELARRFAQAGRGVEPGGALWLLWRKQAAGQGGDLTQAGVRSLGLSRGWVDYKIAAIDATWSGLCFARRKATSALPRRS